MPTASQSRKPTGHVTRPGPHSLGDRKADKRRCHRSFRSSLSGFHRSTVDLGSRNTYPVALSRGLVQNLKASRGSFGMGYHQQHSCFPVYIAPHDSHGTAAPGWPNCCPGFRSNQGMQTWTSCGVHTLLRSIAELSHLSPGIQCLSCHSWVSIPLFLQIKSPPNVWYRGSGGSTCLAPFNVSRRLQSDAVYVFRHDSRRALLVLLCLDPINITAGANLRTGSQRFK